MAARLPVIPTLVRQGRGGRGGSKRRGGNVRVLHELAGEAPEEAVPDGVVPTALPRFLRLVGMAEAEMAGVLLGMVHPPVPRVVHGVHSQTLLRPRLAERLVAQRMLAVPVKQYDDGSQGHRLWRQPGEGVAPPAGGRFKPEILAEADRADER